MLQRNKRCLRDAGRKVKRRSARVWRAQGESNPCFRRERATSWTARRWARVGGRPAERGCYKVGGAGWQGHARRHFAALAARAAREQGDKPHPRLANSHPALRAGRSGENHGVRVRRGGRGHARDTNPSHRRPDVMRLEEVELPPPRPGEARVRHRAIAVNYLDIYYRTGFYPPPPYPFTPGNEGAGEVVAIGKGVKGFRPGDRVAYVSTLGSYAEERNVEAKHLVKLPKSMSYATAAAMMMKGLTAQYLLRQTYKVKKGDVILVHAAAGGVGQILCQWGKALGATVIATVGFAGEGQDRQEMRGQARHPLPRGGFRGSRRRDHQGREMPRRLRRRRQGDVPRFARLPAPVRHVRQLRLGFRRHRILQSRAAGAEGFAVRHAADALHLPRRPRPARQDGARAVCRSSPRAR